MSVTLQALWLPLAVHVPDGLLRTPWLVGGFAVALLLALLGSYRVREEEIPRVALLSAAFFVATLIHLPVGPASVHLLLIGLLGVVLGKRAALAILIGLGLQAVLFGHGGFSTIGVNACVQTLPALLTAGAFCLIRRVPQIDRGQYGACWLAGCFLGALSVLVTLVLESLVILYAGVEDWSRIVPFVFLAHLPIVAMEGIVLGFTLAFLARVKPEMLGISRERSLALNPNEQDKGSPNGKTMNRTASCALTGFQKSLCLLAVLVLLLTERSAYAHRLDAGYVILPDRRIRVESWFDLGGIPKGASIEVFRPGHVLLTKGKLDEDGCFTFSFAESEPLEVKIMAGDGHPKNFVIPQSELAATPGGHDNVGDSKTNVIAKPLRVADDMAIWRERIKEALIGVSFLFSLAAFILSWRNCKILVNRQT